MRAIIKREFKNYLKNPILWVGLLFVVVQLFQILNPYLKLHYFKSNAEIAALKPESIMDADITEGYVRSTKEEQTQLTYEKIQKDMAKKLEMTETESGEIIEELREKGLSFKEMEDYLLEKYDYFSNYGVDYYFEISEFHKADVTVANKYLEESLEEHSFSFYVGRKFADFCGLFMGFFAALLLAFLFIRDTKKDTYELLHTKPVSAVGYVCGKVAGGYLAMLFVWGILTLLFGGLCQYYGMKNGLPVSFIDFLMAAVVYILPNVLMITCIYTVTALLFKTPLPAIPMIVLYLTYSNMGSYGPDGKFGYYGRPLAIMVRFPGQFFETAPPPLVLMNQIFLMLASVLLIILAIIIWKRRRL